MRWHCNFKGLSQAVLRIRIRCLFGPWIRDGLKISTSIRIQDPDLGMKTPDHISESYNKFFGLKYFTSLMRIREGKNSDPG